MKALIVCGSRNWTDVALLRAALDEVHAELDHSEWMLLIEGQARGADKMAGEWAEDMITQRVGHARFPADWDRYGKAAGPIRNGWMLQHLLRQRDENHAFVEVIGFHDDIERPNCGTADMRDRAIKAGVPWTLVTH